MVKPTVKEIRDKIAARKAQRKASKAQKYAKMRLVAAKAPEKLERHLIQLADKYASYAEGIENLRENLGLVRAAKDAPLKTRIASAKEYGLKFRRIAEEAPEKLEEALVEAYQGLNDIAADIEFAAEQMGVPLEEETAEGGMESEPKEIAEGEHEVIEEAEEAGLPVPEEVAEHAEEETEEAEGEPIEEKEAAGSDWFSTDRDESGKAKIPEEGTVPRIAAGGSPDSWVNDRDADAQPSTPTQVKMPQASRKRAGETPASAESFVKDIPQSQGKAAVLQEVPGGTETAPDASEFVEDIPQSQGSSELNKSARKKVTPAGKKAANGSL